MNQKPDFKALLKNAGFKATAGRAELLDVLWRQTEPKTVLEIGAKLSKKLNEVTLYRALEAFADKGFIRRVDLGHMHAHYEMEKSHHHHVVCNECGTIEDVAVCPMPQLERSLGKKFRHIYSHNVEFFGLCETCLPAGKLTA